jgi:hypothetical protein
MEFTFSHFQYTENLIQQRDLFKDCFPETNGEAIQREAHYMWKFHSFPNVIQSWEYACYLDTEIAGYYAAIPYRYKIGEKITTVGMVCDVMTSSKHRGKGIFTKMGKYSTNELSKVVPFTIGYPIRKEVIPGHLKVGWKIPFSMPLYMKFIRLDTLLKTKKIGYLSPLANLILVLYNGFVRTRLNKKCSYTLSTDINDVQGYNLFVNEWSASVPNTLIKDISFAHWRYGAPERTYRFLSIRNKEDKMIGFVSYRKVIKEGVPSYGVLDYMVLPGNEDCHGFINKVLADSAKKENVETIMIMMSKKSASEYLLLKNGFFKSPFVFQLIIKNLTKEFSETELFSEENWHLMWVDSDDL